MEKVYIIYKNSHIIDKDYVFYEKSPLLRRMTSLQKASVEIIAVFKRESPQLYEKLFKENQISIIFATKYGEIQAVTQTASFIFNHDYPVSPTVFQHSVHNCAVGYISILHQLNASHLTISAPENYYQKAFMLAMSKIKTGLLSSICVISADESTVFGEIKAFAKMCILVNPNQINGLSEFNLEEVHDGTFT